MDLHDTTTIEATAFPFLDLPTEIRRLVYDQLTNYELTIHQVAHGGSVELTAIAADKQLQHVGLLGTCRLIRHEIQTLHSSGNVGLHDVYSVESEGNAAADIGRRVSHLYGERAIALHFPVCTPIIYCSEAFCALQKVTIGPWDQHHTAAPPDATAEDEVKSAVALVQDRCTAPGVSGTSIRPLLWRLPCHVAIRLIIRYFYSRFVDRIGVEVTVNVRNSDIISCVRIKYKTPEHQGSAFERCESLDHLIPRQEAESNNLWVLNTC